VLLFAREGQPVPAALQGSPTVGLVREDVSSAGLLAEIERAAGREPVEATEDPPNRAALLTPREADVIRLIAAGHSNVDIARELFVSINSVKSYIRSAYKVIGVTNRSGAILWAIRYGMVATPRSHDEPPAAAPGGGGLDAPALQPAG
jgi:DNA-binding CsgD family transcriptional regulator